MPIDRLFTLYERALSSIAHAAVAIRTVDPGQRHVGVLHRDVGSDEVLLLHLAWHHDLRNQSPGKSYFWIDIPLPTRRLRQVAAICRKVWRSNGRAVPYAFSPPNDCFDQLTGRFLIGPSRFGLTCATFVLAVFEAAGLPLVQYETWPIHRAGDREWQEHVVRQLQESNPPASAEHIVAVQGQIGGERFRPEEVAAAASVEELPVAFPTANGLSEELLRRLNAG